MSFATQPRQVHPDPVVAALYGEGVRFALEMPMAAEDLAVGVPEVGAEDEGRGVRKRRSQTLGRLGTPSPQRPAANFLGSAINSPPQPASLFFLPT